MAFRGRQGSQVVSVIATRCSLKQPRTQIQYMAGSALPFARRLLSQHSLKRGERSSPGDLIHPGDLTSSASVTSNEGELGVLLRSWRLRKKRLKTAAGAIHSIGQWPRNYRLH